MQSIIIRKFIEEEDMKYCLDSFFKRRSLSVARFDLEKKVEDEDILFEYIFIHGDFKFELCLYTNIVFSIEELSLFICKQFKTEVLISDNDINPYSWILITETGKVERVKQIAREDDYFSIQEPEV